MKALFLAFLVILVSGIFYFLFTSTTMYTSSPQILSHSGTLKKAYFAGGCFWCMEGIFESQPGVSEAITGYAGGISEDANYKTVSTGKTKHREAVEVSYDPSVIDYSELVKLYFTQIDPTQADGQFADRGYQYTTAIYTSSPDETQIAKEYIATLNTSKKFDKPVAVVVESFTTFFRAEEYHQDYYKKSAFRYNLYKEGSGRGEYIKKTWGKEIEHLTESDLKSKLTDIQYRVTQEEGTEAPFQNPYWDNHAAGIYVDIVDGSPLFASVDKFDSGTGWPSFTRVMTGASVIEKTDTQLFSTRTEVRSKNANSHLGHLFNDGPVDQGGMRYCINSAALRFIPVADLEKEGYGEYVQYFQKK